jgi:hypothetical protein
LAGTAIFANYDKSSLSSRVDLSSGAIMCASSFRLILLAAMATACSSGVADENYSTYQRYRHPGHMPGGGDYYQRPKHPRHITHAAPQVQSGFYQRPYPFHLDYYRMRWGGSYEPYFGNLYGPPNVIVPPVFSAPWPAYGSPFVPFHGMQ